MSYNIIYVKVCGRNAIRHLPSYSMYVHFKSVCFCIESVKFL